MRSDDQRAIGWGHPLSGTKYVDGPFRPQGLESILDRLQVSAEPWLETVAQFGRRFHRAVGLADHLKAEAQRLGVNWLQGVRSSRVAFAHSPCP